MKSILITFISLLSLNFSLAQNYMPYTLAGTASGDVSVVQRDMYHALEKHGFEMLGDYRPAADANRHVIVVSHPELKKAIAKVGGFTGFAAALRVAVTKENGKLNISYTTPEYWGNAYFQKQFNSVQSNYSAVSSAFKSAFKSKGLNEFKQFGSKKGLTAKNLQGYHYMLGMPYFEDNVELKSFDSYDQAVKTIDANLKGGKANVKEVYSIALPGSIKLYGIGLSGSTGESNFMPTIDISSPKHTAFLPYELLVYKNRAYMLHGRYRIALSFPDLTMGTFMKIVSTPGNIEDLMKSVCK